MSNKIYYHVVMKASSWVIEESTHRDPSMVKNSVNSYVERERAEQNINDPTSRHFKVIKRFI